MPRGTAPPTPPGIRIRTAEERGETSCRAVFVTHRAPHRAFKDGQIVNAILKDALAATGQKPVTPYVGSHLLPAQGCGPGASKTRMLAPGALPSLGPQTRSRDIRPPYKLARLFEPV